MAGRSVSTREHSMDPRNCTRQVADRLARTPLKAGLAPLRATQFAAATSGETPYEVVHEEPIVDLRRYDPAAVGAGTGGDAPPIVIAYPFLNDPSILDFAADRSVVRTYLEAGFPVYVLEWTDASPLDRSLDLGDYVCRFLHNAVDVAREESGSRSVHLQGYSVSAPLVAAFAARFPEAVRTLILQGPPLSFDPPADGDLEPFETTASGLDHEAIAEAVDTVPTEWIEAALLARKPVEYAVTTPLRLWDHLDDDAFVEETGRKLDWLVGGPRIPAATYRQYLADLVLGNRLLEGDWHLAGEPVALDRVEMPVLLVIGREDVFVPRESSVPFLEAIPSNDATVIDLPVGHVGLSMAATAHDAGWPQVREWVASRSANRGEREGSGSEREGG